MKTIVVSGSASKIGKTTLVRNIKQALSRSRVQAIKFGHGPSRAGKDELLFHDLDEGLAFIRERLTSTDIDVLIIESSSIYEHFKPDLGIFLVCPWKPEKASARIARSNANLIIDKSFDPEIARTILQKTLGSDIILPALHSQFLFYERTDHAN